VPDSQPSDRKLRLRALRERRALLSRTIKLLEELRDEALAEPTPVFSRGDDGVLYLSRVRKSAKPATGERSSTLARGHVISFPLTDARRNS
jgi:hypothetical protein